MQIPLRSLLARALIFAALAASCAAWSGCGGGDDGSYGGKKSGSFQPRSGFGWG